MTLKIKPQRKFPVLALGLVASAVILVNAEGLLWAYNQALFTVRFEAYDLLFNFGPGVILVLSTLLLWRQPTHNGILGVAIGAFATISLISGGGFLVGSTLGIVGAALTILNSNMGFIHAISSRLRTLSRKSRSAAIMFVVVLAALALTPIELSYRLYANNATQQTLSGSKLIETPHGIIEYADVGEGYPVLVSHGGALGYTQVESVKQILGNESLRLIVPSRFGYLRTPMPSDASFAAQADSFADLLDALNVSKVIVMGFSFGGPAALQFALRHPDRCSALVMSMAVSHNTPPLSSENLIMQHVMMRSDLGYWAFATSFRPQFLRFMGVSLEVQANMTNVDEHYVDGLLRAMQPISARTAGVMNDFIRGQTEVDLPLDTLTTPTIVFHGKDDGLVNFEYGQYSAQHIPNAKFVPFESGGHFLVGRMDAMHDEIMRFLLENNIINL
jgi:pimeloyl-ACP methyl ester carboxylesterase